MPLKQPGRSQWIEAIEQVQPFDYVVQTYYVCELHFLQEDIFTRGKKKFIVPGKVPTIFGINNNIDNTLKVCNANDVYESINSSKPTNSNRNVGKEYPESSNEDPSVSTGYDGYI